MSRRIPVSVLGATGAVGQRFVQLLADHPWFRIAAVCGSERSAGRPYAEATRWVQSDPIPEAVASLTVQPAGPVDEVPIAFSALDSSVAGEIETGCATAGQVVVSNAKNHRMDPDVPLVVAEVNPDHVELARNQSFGRGAILTNPNCSTIGLVLALKPLADAFGLRKVSVVTLQALSGAGLPGVPALESLDNVIPCIGGEEEKLQEEPAKILGRRVDDAIRPAELEVSAQCNRVAVVDGHLLCVSASFGRRVTPEQALRAYGEFEPEIQSLNLPSAPDPVIEICDRPDGPQPRLHRDAGGGMAITVGRIRRCKTLDLRFVTLSHNTIRGAAGGSILLGELAVAKGIVKGISAP
jgi:aspartate-semialdehyde dehydrogenase